MDAIALVVSILAILISVATAIFEFFNNNRMNNKNLISVYFMELYGSCLFEEMPKAREFFFCDGKKLCGVDEMVKTLRKIRTRSIYFKKSDASFYEILYKELQEFEDYLLNSEGPMDSNTFVAFTLKADQHICNISDIILSSYMPRKKL